MSRRERKQLRWYQVWSTALVHLRTAVWVDLLHKADRLGFHAYGWLAASAVVVAFILTLAQIPTLEQSSTVLLIGQILIMFILATVVVAIFMVAAFTLMVGLTHLASLLLGGYGTFLELAYLKSAQLSPLFILSALQELLPIGGEIQVLITSLINIYQIVLTVIVVKAAHGLPTGKAIVAGLIVPAIVTLILWLAFVAVGSALLPGFQVP